MTMPERESRLTRAARAGYQAWCAPGDTPWHEQSNHTQHAYRMLAAAVVEEYTARRPVWADGSGDRDLMLDRGIDIAALPRRVRPTDSGESDAT